MPILLKDNRDGDMPITAGSLALANARFLGIDI